MTTRLTLSCQSPNWERDLFAFLDNGIEVDLVGFDCEKHGKFCEELAKRFSVELKMDRDPNRNAVYFRAV